MSLPWKGNIRELDNVLERAMILGDGEWIKPADLPGQRLNDEEFGTEDDLAKAIELYEKSHIERTLNKAGGDKMRAAELMNQLPWAFWCVSATEMLQHLETAKEGLSSDEARQRLTRYGSNLLKPQKRSDVFTLLLAQFKSPLILILLFATALSFFLRDPVNALIILTIVLVSGLLGFWQEHSATNAVKQLLAMMNCPRWWARLGRGSVFLCSDFVTSG